ncbi:cyclic nucleotide-binding domain-containing protein [Spirosoma spitsbergense]|uniref:cyclic nucleotide-binding domain-containing protein n=1 Tax=Spirosoma spitsbergense TaxID=431554 RepID=UPI00036CC7A1
MKELTDYILQFGHLNQQQIDLIVKKAAVLPLQEGDYFSEAGKIARQVGFIVEGVIRVCYYTNKGDDVTRYFIDENNFVVDLNSYDNSIPSSEYIQAVTNCRLIVFSHANWHELSGTIIGWMLS